MSITSSWYKNIGIFKIQNFDENSKILKWPYLQFPRIQNPKSRKIQKIIKIPHFYPLRGAYWYGSALTGDMITSMAEHSHLEEDWKERIKLAWWTTHPHLRVEPN